MKNLLIVLLSVISITTFGQKQSKYQEINFKVSGVCGMCENRIEGALDVSGIRLAEWNSKTDNCRVVYNTTKFTELQIHQLIADVGHDTDKVKAKSEVYNKLNSCCKYKAVEKH